MIEEIGIVKDINDNFAKVVVYRNSMCGDCPSKSICHPFDNDNNDFEIIAFNKINAKTGDKVKLSIEDKKFIKASLIIYGVPILFLIIFSIIGKIILKKDLFSFLTGFSGMLLSFIIIRSYDKKNKENFKPQIVEIINENSSNK